MCVCEVLLGAGEGVLGKVEAGGVRVKPPKPGAKKGTTSTRADSPPGFEGVLWADDMEIDFGDGEGGTLLHHGA